MIKSSEESKPYTEEEALEQSSKIQEEINTGEVKNHNETEKSLSVKRAFLHEIGHNYVWPQEAKPEILQAWGSLLAVSKNQDYQNNVMKLLLIWGKQMEKKYPEFLYITNVLAVPLFFKDLTDEDRETIKSTIEKELESLERKSSQSLKEYISEKLHLESKELYDPAEGKDDEQRMVMATLAVMNSGNLESFSISTSKRVSSEELRGIVTSYYQNQGYEIEKIDAQLGNDIMFWLKKGNESYSAVLSNFGDNIMVTVRRS